MKTHKREFSADGKMLDLWRRLVDTEFVKRRKALPRRVNKTLEKFVAIGAAESGGAYSRVRAAYDSEIDKRAEIVLRILEKVHRKVGSPPITEALQKEVKDRAGGCVEAIVKEVAGCMDERRPAFKLPESLFDFEDKEREVKEGIDVELDLFFASVVKKPETPPTGKRKKGKAGAETMNQQEWNAYLVNKAEIIDEAILDEAKRGFFDEQIKVFCRLSEEFQRVLEKEKEKARADPHLRCSDENMPPPKPGMILETYHVLDKPPKGFWREKLPFNPEAYLARFYAPSMFLFYPPEEDTEDDVAALACETALWAAIHDFALDAPAHNRFCPESDTLLDLLWQYVKPLINMDDWNTAPERRRKLDASFRRVKAKWPVKVQASEEQPESMSQKPTAKADELGGAGQKGKRVEEPKATQWAKVTIEIVDDNTVRYKIGSAGWQRATCEALGFFDKRKELPNTLWPLFREMAKCCKNRCIELRTQRNVSKCVDRICDTLKKFFGPQDRPICYDRRARKYRVEFDLSDPRVSE